MLLVDDSIVRGTTSEQIVSMARAAGAKKIYFASAAPEIRYPNVYGIDMPTKQELIAYGRNVDEIAKLIGVDKLVFQDLEALTESVRQENPTIQGFDVQSLLVNISLAISHQNTLIASLLNVMIQQRKNGKKMQAILKFIMKVKHI